MAMIGGFRSDLSITCMSEEILETFPRVFCFPKSRINGNGGNGNSEESVVEANRCLSCSTVVPKKEKLYIFGKLPASIDFCEIIKSTLNVNVRNFSTSKQIIHL